MADASFVLVCQYVSCFFFEIRIIFRSLAANVPSFSETHTRHDEIINFDARIDNRLNEWKLVYERV